MLILFCFEIKFDFVACNSHEKSFLLNCELHTYFQFHFLKYILLPRFILAPQIQFGSFVISFNLERDIERKLNVNSKFADSNKIN